MLSATKLSKAYTVAGKQLPVLTDIDLSVEPGNALSIIGPSGSGKSTLLYILGALEPPTAGTVTLDGEDPYAMGAKALAAFRNRQIGFVFQDHHLLPQCNVVENVLIPSLVAPPDASVENRARDLLEQVGLSSRIGHYPHELSGGEKQRVALARALILQPRLLLCDEPTGNLDRDSTETIASLILDIHRRQKNILIFVTHNLEVANKFAVKYRLADGHLLPV